MVEEAPAGISNSISELLEKYFCRLLRVDRGSFKWKPWREALETFADWFVLLSGTRGSGLAETILYESIGRRQQDRNLIEHLKFTYALQVEEVSGVLRPLQEAGILVEQRRRWRFSYEIFEDYFAAGRILHYVSLKQRPDLSKWEITRAQREQFCPVLDFVKEMADSADLKVIAEFAWPEEWKDRLGIP
jgi:hypothetical protein